MQKQIEREEGSLLAIRDEGLRQKKIMGMDISKLALLTDRLKVKKMSILEQQKKLQAESNEFIEKQRLRHRDSQDVTFGID